MLIFGHVGITIGIVKAFDYAISHFLHKSLYINYKIVAVGALLPDLLDKPVIEFLYGLKNHSSHFFAHTFWFSGALILIGLIILIVMKNIDILMLGITSLMHQLFDMGVTLFENKSSLTLIHWSRIILRHLGFSQNAANWLFSGSTYFSDVVLYLMTPYVFISEILGIFILAFVFKTPILSFIKATVRRLIFPILSKQ